MTALLERTAEITQMPTRRTRIAEGLLGAAGVLAAGVGAWMYYVPATWFLGGLAEAWFLGMFIAAGVLLTAALGIYARVAYTNDRAWNARATIATVLAVAAFVGAIVFAVILFI